MLTPNRYSRQADLIPMDLFTHPIHVIGCGAIGSFTVLTLAKMGFTDITVYDHDTVDEENISNQFYRMKDVGTPKAVALHQMIKDFEAIEIKHYVSKWLPKVHHLKGIAISAVDNMTTRKALFTSYKRNPDVCLFMDGRMGGYQAEVYTVLTDEDRAVYKETLWRENEASEARCTEKAVMFNVLWIASAIANNIRLALTGEYKRILIYDLQNTMLHTPERR